MAIKELDGSLTSTSVFSGSISKLSQGIAFTDTAVTNATDILLEWNQKSNVADISFINGDVVLDSGFKTAITVTLFSDARAGDDDIVDGVNRRGFWADTIPEIAGSKTGSKYWLRYRSPINNRLLLELRDDTYAATEYLVKDKVVISRDVNVSRLANNPNGVMVSISLVQTDGRTAKYTYDMIWNK